MLNTFSADQVKNISVFGAGAWGTALSLHLARKFFQVTLWHFDPEQAARIQTTRENEYFLPGVYFPGNLNCTNDINAAVTSADLIVIVVPSQAFRGVLTTMKPLLKTTQPVVWATKGIDAETVELLDHAAVEILGDDFTLGVISGPNFANEVARGLPTASTVATNHAAALAGLVEVFKSPTMGIAESMDITGAEVGGIVKNVIAIVVGISDGLGFGANARAALITKGLDEMIALGVKLGAKEETIIGLAGVGDLILTCTDNQSRNRRFGLLLGEGVAPDEALTKIGQVVEGYLNVRQLKVFAEKNHVTMPVAEAVARMCFEKADPRAAIMELMQW